MLDLPLQYGNIYRNRSRSSGRQGWASRRIGWFGADRGKKTKGNIRLKSMEKKSSPTTASKPHPKQMMMIAFITMNSGLVPLIEGRCAQILFFRFEIIGCLRSHLLLFFFRKKKYVKDKSSQSKISSRLLAYTYPCVLFTIQWREPYLESYERVLYRVLRKWL